MKDKIGLRAEGESVKIVFGMLLDMCPNKEETESGESMYENFVFICDETFATIVRGLMLSAKLLAVYLHNQLKDKNNLTKQKWVSVRKVFMKTFKCLDEKDFFKQAHQCYLRRRLLKQEPVLKYEKKLVRLMKSKGSINQRARKLEKLQSL